MRKLISHIIIIFICILSLFFSACGNISALPDHRERAFHADIAWSMEELYITASVTYNAKQEIKVEFTSPKSLSDISVTASSDNVYAECGDIHINSPLLYDLIEHAKLMIPSGERKMVSYTEINGRRLTYGEIYDEESKNKYELYLIPDTGIPVCVACDDKRIEVLSFEYINI